MAIRSSSHAAAGVPAGAAVGRAAPNAGPADAAARPYPALAKGAQIAATKPPARRRALEPGDLLARLVIATLFLAQAAKIYENYLETGRLTGLLLLASELLVVVLTIVRRPASTVDRSVKARAFTAMSMAGPPLLRPAAGGALAPDWVTASVSAIGLLAVVLGKISLGRSFGLVPANRGIVSSGLYRFVRHPIYLGYLVTHLAFLAAHPTGWNILAVLVGDVALLVRAVIEERTLVRDPQYAAYAERVRWRIVPNVF